jgi:hypothetical protein
VCNGRSDCPLGEDERNCRKYFCFQLWYATGIYIWSYILTFKFLLYLERTNYLLFFHD